MSRGRTPPGSIPGKKIWQGIPAVASGRGLRCCWVIATASAYWFGISWVNLELGGLLRLVLKRQESFQALVIPRARMWQAIKWVSPWWSSHASSHHPTWIVQGPPASPTRDRGAGKPNSDTCPRRFGPGEITGKSDGTTSRPHIAKKSCGSHFRGFLVGRVG